MFEDFILGERPVTAEHVLRVFQDWHTQEIADGDIGLEGPLTFDTTIAEWRDADDFSNWRDQAKAMNNYWEITVPTKQWKAVLHPAAKRKLRGVCELIAREAKVAEIPEVKIFGRKCREAGAFLAVRKMLAESGANGAAIAPSTSLDKYTRRYAWIFNGPICKLAPGTLPVVKADHPIYNFTIYGIGIAFLFVGFSFLVADPWLEIIAVSLICIFYVGIHVAAVLPPRHVAVGELRTFRDLAKALASSERRNLG